MKRESSWNKITIKSLLQSVGQLLGRKKPNTTLALPTGLDVEESIVEHIILLDRLHGRQSAVQYFTEMESRIIKNTLDVACPRIARRTIELAGPTLFERPAQQLVKQMMDIAMQTFADQPELLERFVYAVQKMRIESN